jgi:hypothetical protein
LPFTRKECARNLRQHTGAITTFSIGSHAAAVRHTPDRHQRIRQDRVVRLTAEASDKTDTACISFKSRVVQAALLQVFQLVHLVCHLAT